MSFIKRFIARDRRRTALSASAINELVDAINALTGMEVRRGAYDALVVAGQKAILTLRSSEGGGTGTGNMNYRGTYDNAEAYAVGDVVRVVSGTSKGIWICVTAQGPSGTAPVFPETGSPPWEMFAFGVGSFDYRDPDTCAAYTVPVNMGEPAAT